MLAIGSNQSPRRLTEKFGDDANHVIPVQRAFLEDFDVVYSAHISSYGAVPAMLQVSEGSEVEVAVTWLSDTQLEVMSHSEIHAANYGFALLDGLRLRLEDGQALSRAYVYVSCRGHLRHHDGAVALAAIRCHRRRYRAMETFRALELVRERLAPAIGADEFVLRLIADVAYRHEISSLLGADATPFSYPFELLR